MKMTTQSAINNNKPNTKLFLFATALGVIFNVLFQRLWQLNVNYTILIFLIVAVTYITLKHTLGFNRGHFLVGAFTMLALAFYFSLYTNQFFKMVNFVLIPVFYGCSILFAYGYRPRVLSILRLLFLPLLSVHHYFLNSVKILSPSKEVHSAKRSVFIGIILSILLLLIIVPLMISSDQMITALLTNWFKDLHFDVVNLLSYLFWFAMVASYAYASLRLSLRTSCLPADKALSEGNTNALAFPGRKTTITTVLSVLTAVYILFFALQLFYLVGNLRLGLPANFDYAAYARSGFFQLLALSLINILILSVTFYLLKNEQNLHFVKVLLVLFTFLTLLLACSSLYRMYLYEHTYGYTMLRLIVFLFLYFEIATLLLTFAFIYRPSLPVAKIVLIAAVLYYTVIIFANPEAYVAKKNIDRYFETGKLDSAYLSGLSVDAAPQILRLQDEENPEILFFLQQQHRRASSFSENHDIRAYNYARYRAADLYAPLALKTQWFQIYLQNNSSAEVLSFNITGVAFSASSAAPLPSGESVMQLLSSTPSATYTVVLQFADGQSHSQTLVLFPDFDKATYLSIVDENGGRWIYTP